ncbi:beta family protein [Erwinia tasmaniensis]|uniref:beta family protein n=1 Tax=Erwinia tasmaniensis TaxID=338565 RepID=UPI003A4E1B87
MTKYVPFLKAKANEILAIGEIYKSDSLLFTKITPFFDVPRESKDQSVKTVLNKVGVFKNKLDSNFILKGMEFYIDNYDLDDEIDIQGIEQYEYLLSLLTGYKYIPVVGLNRSDRRNNSAYNHLLHSRNSLALRLVSEDIESYRISKMRLEKFFTKIQSLNIKEIHLIIDLRFISPNSEKMHIDNLKIFLSNVNKEFHFDKIIISGSSIPANISELIETYTSKSFVRAEWKIWESLLNEKGITNITYADYGIVSPDYSDIELDPKLFRKISTPKVFYTYKNNCFCVRGGSFQNDPLGNGQYFQIATIIHDQKFFRHVNFSYGEKYVYDRSSYSLAKPDKAGSPSSWLKAMLTTHISFVLNSLP